MTIILIAIYGSAALFALFCGRVYPDAEKLSYLIAGSCVLHLILALVVAWRPLVDAGKIAAWSWQSSSAILAAGLLTLYGLGKGAGWLLVAVALAIFTILVTLILALVLKRGGIAER